MVPPDEAPAEPQRFWNDLCCAVSAPCADHEQIDDALRTWLDLVSAGRDRFLQDEDDLARCSQCLLASPLCADADVRAYVHTQIVYSLLQEDEARPLHAIANYLLLAGRRDEAVFHQMVDAGCFARLVELISGRRNEDRRLHRLLLELMYEMARGEHVRASDLLHVDDGFVSYLFQIIEDLSDDVDDPYHYPVIRVLLVLNEQYMVAATTAAVNPMSPTAPLTNRVVKVLSLNGPLFRTFGENLILMLNRATETALQLLILKLLYLLFTTGATYEYFYTNDLRVLLDVIIRNLLDLPNESASLRHTYLRVLYPLLAHTQLKQPPQYKRGEILSVLAILSGSGNAHFAPADETTLRLVDRVANVSWLAAPTPPPLSPTTSPSSPTDTAATAGTTGTNGSNGSNGTAATVATTAVQRTSTVSSADSVLTASISSVSTTDDDNNSTGSHVDADRNLVVNKFLGISLSPEGPEGRESRTSIADVATATEKPGVRMPSRTADVFLADPDRPPAAGDNAAPAEVLDAHHVDNLAKQTRTPPPRPPLPPLPPQSSLSARSSPTPPSPTASPPQCRLLRRPRRRVLPAVPEHRHGVLMKPPPPPPAQLQPAEAAAGAALAGAAQAQVVAGAEGSAAASEAHAALPTATAAAAAAAAVASAAAHVPGPHILPRLPHPPAHHLLPHLPHPLHPPHPPHHASSMANGGSHSIAAGVKKLPPKAPPPRRAGRLKLAASSANLHQAAATAASGSLRQAASNANLHQAAVEMS